jgi:putative hydrolase of the HAD superfamily
MRAILFDFGGTLDFPRHWLDRFVDHYRAAGVDISRVELDPAFRAATRSAYTAGTKLQEYGLSALVDFLIGLQFETLRQGSAACRYFPELMRSGSIVRELTARIRDGFVAESARGFACSRPLLASLAERFKIAVVSNFYGNLECVLSEAGLASSVRVVTDSSQVGFYKPDIRIFATALANLGVAPRQAVMVGDSIDKDCAPAHAMGLATVWLRHREFRARAVRAVDPVDFTIDRLEELNNLTWLKD